MNRQDRSFAERVMIRASKLEKDIPKVEPGCKWCGVFIDLGSRCCPNCGRMLKR